ncbi:MAG: hypothetical protein KDK39_01270 [Leptospiraceae bacterium]|nr:hypothetical protein [Leptospiraceae bacterium]
MSAKGSGIIEWCLSDFGSRPAACLRYNLQTARFEPLRTEPVPDFSRPTEQSSEPVVDGQHWPHVKGCASSDIQRISPVKTDCREITLAGTTPPLISSDLAKPRILYHSRSSVILLLRYDQGTEEKLPVEVFDAKGRLRGRYVLELADRMASWLTLHNNSLLVFNCVGAGPGCGAGLHDPLTGKQRLSLDNYAGRDMYFNAFGASVLESGPGELTLLAGDAAALVRVDTRQRKVLQSQLILQVNPDTGSRALPVGTHNLAVLFGGPGGGRLQIRTLAEYRLVREDRLPNCAADQP